MVTLQVESSFGIASARHSTCVQHHESLFSLDVPLGMSVSRWDVKDGRRNLFFQAHSDAIMAMQADPYRKWIVTASYSGEVKIWNMEWKLLATQQAPSDSVSCVAWSKDASRLFITTNGFHSYLSCYEIKGTSDSDVNVQLLWKVMPPDAVAKKAQIQEVKQHLSPAKAFKYGDIFSACVVTESGNCIVMEERDNQNGIIHLYSFTGSLLKSQEIFAKSAQKESDLLVISDVKDGIFVLSLLGGSTLVMNSETLEIITSFEAGFSSRTLAWDGDNIILPDGSGRKITWWNKKGQLVYTFTGLPVDDYIVCTQLGLDRSVLWVCGVSSLMCLLLARNDEGVIQSASLAHSLPTTQEIACCGLALSPDMNWVVVGDMVGNVWIYHQKETRPTHHQNVGLSVRCIIWSNDNTVLVGDLGGNMYSWIVNDGVFGLWTTLDGSVIHLRQSHSKKFIAAGTSKGVLVVYGSDLSKPVATVPAHSPVEIWSICWSPSDDRVATCSEDQTTKVWHCNDWKELAVLKGHTMAVTSVDWSVLDGVSLLASSSDDQTVRLYSGDTLELQQVLSASGLIHGWFTLTYLKFYEQGKMLCVTTQNGHVVIWRIGSAQSADVMYHGRVHGGSVEGLDVGQSSGLMTTCSADCVVHVVSIH